MQQGRSAAVEKEQVEVSSGIKDLSGLMRRRRRQRSPLKQSNFKSATKDQGSTKSAQCSKGPRQEGDAVKTGESASE